MSNTASPLQRSAIELAAVAGLFPAVEPVRQGNPERAGWPGESAAVVEVSHDAPCGGPPRPFWACTTPHALT